MKYIVEERDGTFIADFPTFAEAEKSALAAGTPTRVRYGHYVWETCVTKEGGLWALGPRRLNPPG